tara:strand:+ start:5751 stop:6242 length:492 start_codon:yes stop_codon:yes gene_type:complete
MARVVLDYDASVPGVDNQRASFNVKADPSKPIAPPGSRFKDYVPNPNVTIAPVVADDKVARKNFMRKPTVTSELDYVSPDDAKAKRANDKGNIIRIAKEIYADQSKKRKVYDEAVEMLEKDTDGEEITLKDLERARKIVDRGPPISKQQAMDRATSQFYGLRS